VACCDCSCGNIAMMEWAMQYLNPDLLSRVREKLYAATKSSAFAPSSAGSTPTVPSNPGTVTPGTSENHDGRSAQSTGSSRGVTPRGTETESSDTSPGETGAGSAYEVTEKGGTVQAKTGLPVAAILGVVVLVALVGVGYFIGGKGRI
jgi:cobaltochelatase CobN